MADPLSITASIITVVGAANAVAKGLRRLKAAKDAPEGLQDLILDVAQIEMVLNGVKSAVLSSGSPSIELATLIEEAGSKLLELRSLIEYTLKKAGGSDKVDRWQWLRKGNEVERLRNQLGTIRLNLVALTSSANLCVPVFSKAISFLECIVSIRVLLADFSGPALVVFCSAFLLLLKTYFPNSSDSMLR